MRRLILFDIDGTLLLSAGAGRRAVLRAITARVGAAPAYAGVRFDGKTDPQILAELLHAAGHSEPCDPALLAELAALYLAELEAEFAAGGVRAALLPGVLPLLEALEARDDMLVGLLTGNLERGARLKLRAAGLDPARFRVGAYGSDSGVRSDLPPVAARRASTLMGREPTGHEVVIVGDTPNDILCGRGIGARAVAVATGSYGADELRTYAPHALLADLGDTAAALAALCD